jgi:ribosome-binding factor A
VTVTAVDTTPDLRAAKMFVSVLGSEEDIATTLRGLQSSHGFLQRRVAEELHLKHTPTLEFVFDDTTQRADRINRLT